MTESTADYNFITDRLAIGNVAGDQPKEESGTRHCWEHSAAPVKIHVGLDEMLRFSSHRPV